MTAGIGPWRGMMRQAIQVQLRTGQDVNAKPTFGTATSYRARIVGKRRRVVAPNGEEVISNQTVYVASGDVIPPTAKVTLTTGDVGSTESVAINPPILATGTYPDETGRNVYTALFL